MAGNEVGTYYVSVVPNMKNFNSAVAKGGNSLLKTIGSIGIGKALGDVLSSGVNAFMGSLNAGISRVDIMNTFPQIMENVGISAEASARAVDALAAGVDGLPTTLDSAVAATQRFALQNGNVEQSAQMFLALNDAILAGGQSAEMQASALEQISQAYAKGRPDMMEWRTMTMTMGPALQMVAQSWGMSVDEMGEALRSGDRSMDEFLQTIQQLDTEGVGDFKSLQEQASVTTSTIGSALANVAERASAVWAAILNSIGTEDIVNTINTLSSGFMDFGENVLAPVAGQVVDAFRQIFDTISGLDFSWLVDGIQPLIGAFGEFINGEGTAFEGMMERVNIAIENGGYAIQLFQDAFDHLKEAFGPFIETIAPVMVELVAHLGGYIANVIPIIIGLAAKFIDAIAGIMDFVTQAGAAFGRLPGIIKSNIAEAKPVFEGLVNFVKDIPNKIVSFFSGIGSRISSAIGSIHFPTPHISWESTSIPGLSLPKIQWYGAGGFVNGATIIGAGERGTELIWPSYGNALDKYADAIARRMPEGAGATVTNVYLNDLIVNDDSRIRADVLQLVEDLGRFSSMNRGQRGY